MFSCAVWYWKDILKIGVARVVQIPSWQFLVRKGNYYDVIKSSLNVRLLTNIYFHFWRKYLKVKTLSVNCTEPLFNCLTGSKVLSYKNR